MTSSDSPKGIPAEPAMEVATKPSAPEPGGPEGNAMLRFTLVTGAWFVGLFGLMRLSWVERVVLTPFAEVQQRVADQLTGAPSDLVYADASCRRSPDTLGTRSATTRGCGRSCRRSRSGCSRRSGSRWRKGEETGALITDRVASEGRTRAVPASAARNGVLGDGSEIRRQLGYKLAEHGARLATVDAVPHERTPRFGRPGVPVWVCCDALED